MGTKNATEKVSGKSLGYLVENPKLRSETIGLVMDHGMDWKQKIDARCLSTISATEKSNSELREIIKKAAPVAYRVLLENSRKENANKLFLESKAQLVMDYMEFLKVSEAQRIKLTAQEYIAK